MFKRHFSYCLIALLGTPLCQADSRHYQTAPAEPATAQSGQFEIPLIEVDPDSGDRRVYLTPRSDTQALAVSARYRAQPEPEAVASALQQAIGQLHQQMTAACPQGWVKLEEWAVTEGSQINLHYAFACIGQ